MIFVEASFSENFYNLKRIKSYQKGTLASLWKRLLGISPINSGGSEQNLSKSQIIRQTIMMHRNSKSSQSSNEDNSIKDRDRKSSLLFLVFIPYIKSKLDDYYRKQSDPLTALGLINTNSNNNDDPQDNSNQNSSSKRKEFINILKKIFLKVYPVISAMYEALFFVYQVLYLYEYTNFYTPFLHFQKINLKRITHQDIENHNSIVENRRRNRINIVRNWPFPSLFIPLVKVLDSILDYSKFILPVSVFLFKSLEWWYSENRISAPSLPIPPPPSPTKRASGGLPIPDDKSVCPLCCKERTNPAICGSGFVFCYPCIFKYVEEHHKCPITFIPASTEQLRKIYETV
eukprot:gene4977-6198_t